MEIFELAYTLRMSVHDLVTTMPNDEYWGWVEYFQQRPPEWRSDYRASVIAGSFAGKFNAEKAFPALAQLSLARKKAVAKPEQSLKTSMFMTLMRNAQGGEKLPCLWEGTHAEDSN